jgi:TIR domain
MANTTGAEERFLYDAFISYRHVQRDTRWADWLIAELERYRVPKSLQARGAPPKLRKVFRDQDEAYASADLNELIKEALKNSRFLIVICSPYTPRSKWVSREIQMFNELGRSDNVLALLTEGEPNDSFPDAMLAREERIGEAQAASGTGDTTREPLAADVRSRRGMWMRQVKRIALLRLLARMLDVPFDDLRQRASVRSAAVTNCWRQQRRLRC